MNTTNETKIIDVDAKKEKTQKILTILIIVALALMIPVLIINCTLIVKQLANPDVPPSLFGNIPQYINDDMDNLGIKKGDMIFIKKAEPADIEVGDVIFFKTASGKYILQEVDSLITTNGELKGWYTKEPNEAFGLNVAFTSQLLGEYNGTRLWGVGAVATFTQTIPGIIICMAIPLGLLVAYEIVCAKKKEKEADDDKAQLLAELEALRKAKAEAEKEEAPTEAPVAEKADEVAEEPTEDIAESSEFASTETPEENGEETPAE